MMIVYITLRAIYIVLVCSYSLKELLSDDHIKDINKWWIDRLKELEDFLKEHGLDKDSISN